MAGSSEFSYDYGAGEEARNQLVAASNRIDGHVTQLENYARNDLSSWSGEAQTQYYECKRRWDAAIARMNHILGKAGGTVGDQHSNMRNTDNNAGDAFRGGR